MGPSRGRGLRFVLRGRWRPRTPACSRARFCSCVWALRVSGHSEVSWKPGFRQGLSERLTAVRTLSLSGPCCPLAFVRQLGRSPGRALLCRLLPPLPSRTETLSLGSVPTRTVPWEGPVQSGATPCVPPSPRGRLGCSVGGSRGPQRAAPSPCGIQDCSLGGEAGLQNCSSWPLICNGALRREAPLALCLRQGDRVARGGTETAVRLVEGISQGGHGGT